MSKRLDWIDYVRRNLSLPELTREREEQIREDLARQFEQAYADALARGAVGEEAEAAARAHVPDWDSFISDVYRSERRNAKPRLDRWSDLSEARTNTGGVMSGMNRWLSDLRQDVIYGLRTLRKSPGFTAVAVLTLALGIGANTAIFSVINAVLLEPLPFGDPDAIVAVYESPPDRFSPSFFSPGMYLDWKEHNDVFESMSVISGTGRILTGEGEPEQLLGVEVAPEFFSLLRVPPLLGRGFLPGEDLPGNDQVVVLSYGLWQRRFGGDPDVVNRTVTLTGKSCIVVGVMPEGFAYRTRELTEQFWVPFTVTAELRTTRNISYLHAVARLKPGVGPEQAQSRLNALTRRLEEEFSRYKNSGAFVTPLHRDRVIRVRAILWLLQGAVGFVLLIACANVANLLLARAATRDKEVAVRAALGAARHRLLWQFLTESLLVSSLGGVLGLGLAWGTMRVLVAVAPTRFPHMENIGLDGAVLGFALALSIVTSLLFGLAPALQSSRPDLIATLKEGTRSGGGGFSLLRHNRLRNLLVVGEVALALVLLVGAGLLLNSFARLVSEETGFRSEKLFTAIISLPEYRYPEAQQQRQFLAALLERLEELPGTVSVAGVNAAPFSGRNSMSSFQLEEKDEDGQNRGAWAEQRQATPGYFRTLGIPLLAGRTFSQQDGPGAPPIAVVNETFARENFPDQGAVGKRILLGGSRTIVGVVGSIKHRGLGVELKPEVYRPFGQSTGRHLMVMVRTHGDPSAMAGALRSVVRSLDPDLPISRLTTMEGMIAKSLTGQRFMLSLLGAFAGVAALLAAVGIYGVMAFAVGQRTHEIGVRMALGAQQAHVLKLVLLQGGILSGIGVVLGIGGAYALTRYMEALLYEITPTDPATFVAISILLVSVSLLACWVPARRATKIDPMVALRYE